MILERSKPVKISYQSLSSPSLSKQINFSVFYYAKKESIDIRRHTRPPGGIQALVISFYFFRFLGLRSTSQEQTYIYHALRWR